MYLDSPERPGESSWQGNIHGPRNDQGETLLLLFLFCISLQLTINFSYFVYMQKKECLKSVDFY